MCFCENDIIEICINILTPQGLVDIETFNWVKYQKASLSTTNFIDLESNFIGKNINEFDTCRICELEIMNKGWQYTERPENNSIINKVKFIFEPTFLVQKMVWDDVGYDLYKFYLIAAKRGKRDLD